MFYTCRDGKCSFFGWCKPINGDGHGNEATVQTVQDVGTSEASWKHEMEKELNFCKTKISDVEATLKLLVFMWLGYSVFVVGIIVTLVLVLK